MIIHWTSRPGSLNSEFEPALLFLFEHWTEEGVDSSECSGVWLTSAQSYRELWLWRQSFWGGQGMAVNLHRYVFITYEVNSVVHLWELVGGFVWASGFSLNTHTHLTFRLWSGWLVHEELGCSWWDRTLLSRCWLAGCWAGVQHIGHQASPGQLCQGVLAPCVQVVITGFLACFANCWRHDCLLDWWLLI